MMLVNDNPLWLVLVALKQKLGTLKETFQFVIVEIEKETFNLHINDNKSNISNKKCIIISKDEYPKTDNHHTHIKISNLLDLEIQSKGALDKNELIFLKQYLPYVFLSIQGKERKSAVTISHFAQTLDGKIATNSGNSQWIGNDENLIHSHRMRALCDAILIGTNTLKNDIPSLTVRKVVGKNPIKVVIGNSKSPCFSSLQKEDEKIIYFTSNKASCCKGIETVIVKSQNKSIDCAEILSQLFQQGIYSIYIEGGGKTASSFLESNQLDIIQLHIAPMIMGSGISNFELPEIKTIDAGVTFKSHTFTPMDDHMMFTGEVKNK